MVTKQKSRVHQVVLLGVLVLNVNVAAASPGGATAVADSSTLSRRIERVCRQIDNERARLHVPGCALAVIMNDQIILSRGLGVRDLDANLPVTEDTLFAIGSTTKAFTATLLGMLVDEGRVTWDDHPRHVLPEFRLKDPHADTQVTIRDLLCHRVGLASNDILWYGGSASRADILRTVADAELLHPFRAKFNYNNVMFLAAGEIAGRAAGSDWDSLIAERIFLPLGMHHSNTSVKVAKSMPRLSKGYMWDKDKSIHTLKPMRDLDNIAPAGSINSCAKDMANWIRFLLNKGQVDGVPLIEPARLEETWTRQIDISGDAGYGLGWMVREWNGRRLLEHSGGIDGFGAYVALLPDDSIGYALLTNVTASALQPMSINIVFDNLLHELPEDEEALDVAAVQPLLGKYHFDVLKTDVTVVLQRGKLAIDVPGQMVYELKPPDQHGKWVFAITDQIAASFERNETGEVTALKMYQAGLEFELPRQGVEPPTEIDAHEARPYLGVYHSDDMKADLTVLHRNGRLALDVPKQMVYDLHMPDAEGHWAFRAKKSITVRFNRNDEGDVISLTLFQNGLTFNAPRTFEPQSDLPSLEEVLSLHRKGHGTANLPAIKSLTLSGTLKFTHQGLNGAMAIAAAGLNRFTQTLDLGQFGFITSALNEDKAWHDSTFGGFEELQGEYHQQTRLQHPLVIAADWRDFFEHIQMDRVDSVGGKKAFVLVLQVSKEVSYTTFLDAELGRVIKDELVIRNRDAGPIKTTITYDEYRDIHGVMLPVRYTIANEANGEMVVAIERIETNIDLPADAFTLTPRAR